MPWCSQFSVPQNYNGEHLLPACLDSLASQKNADMETIVVDNNSSDGSAALVAQKYPQVKFLALDKNYGFSGANNAALRDALARNFDYALLLQQIDIVRNTPRTWSPKLSPPWRATPRLPS